MAFADVWSKVEFYTGTESWGDSAMTAMSQTEKDSFEAGLFWLYNNVPEVQALLDSFVLNGDALGQPHLRVIGGDEYFPDSSAHVLKDDVIPGVDVILSLKIGEIEDNYWYVNELGQVVANNWLMTLAHELHHAITPGSNDPQIDASDTAKNSSGYEFDGDAVDLENAVADVLGIGRRASYEFGFLKEGFLDMGLSLGQDLTNEEEIDTARWGYVTPPGITSDNNLDMTAHGNSRDLLLGLEGNDTIRGGGGNDHLYGGLGTDELYGGTGMDRLFGGAEDDEIYGGDDDDLLTGDDGADVIDGGNGNDTVSYEFAAQAVTLSLFGGTPGGAATGDTITNVESIIGSAFADTLSIAGGTTGGLIDANAGNDTLTGSGYGDELRGDGGNDTISAGAGADYITGGAGNDIIHGDEGDDALGGTAGDDQLFGDGGNDSLSGGDGNDTLDGGLGSDFLSGGAGDDFIVVNHDQSVVGGAGSDTLSFTNTTLQTLNPLTWDYQFEVDPNDVIWYDGNQIGAVGAEKTVNHHGTTWYDDTGTSYLPNWQEDQLTIILPNNEKILLTGWNNGDMGISFILV